jgi:hypothetical protein
MIAIGSSLQFDIVDIQSRTVVCHPHLYEKLKKKLSRTELDSGFATPIYGVDIITDVNCPQEPTGKWILKDRRFAKSKFWDFGNVEEEPPSWMIELCIVEPEKVDVFYVINDRGYFQDELGR